MHRAFEVPLRGEVAGGAEQHRRMPVMAAGVHFDLIGRSVGEIVQFLDRQCIHIGAQPDRRRRIAAPDSADYPGPGEPAMDLAAELGELCRDQVRGAPLREGQFRVGVDIPADRRQLVLIVAHFGNNRHRPLPFDDQPLSFLPSIIEGRQMSRNSGDKSPIWGSLSAEQRVERLSRDWPHASDIGIRHHRHSGEFGGMRAATVASDQFPRLRQAATAARTARIPGNDKVRR
jgi:hypothetical protein